MHTIRIILLILGVTIPLSADDEGMLRVGDGAELYWRAAGSGPGTLIVPGAFLLEDHLAPLAREFRVISYDMRNRGRSSRVTDPARLTIGVDVEDLEAVRRHFGVDRFSTIGYSYLGKMVVLYALSHPGRIERIVQAGAVPMRFRSAMPPTLDNSGERVLDPVALANLRAARRDGLVERDPKRYCEMEWSVVRAWLVGDAARAAGRPSLCHMPNEWPSNLAFHLRHHFGSAQVADVSPVDLASLDVPVLTIHGTKDRNAPYGGGVEWAAMLPEARLLTVEGAAHDVWVDDPDVVRDVATFFHGAWPGRSTRVDMASNAWLAQLRGVELLQRARQSAGPVSEDGQRAAETYRFEGATFPASQSVSARPPYDRFPLEETVTIDTSGHRIAVEQTLQWPDFVAWHRILVDGERSVDLDLVERRVLPAWESPEETEIRQLARLPHLLLEELLESPGRVRWVGLQQLDGMPHEVVSAAIGGTTVSIVLDEDARVRRVSRLTSSDMLGDVEEVTDLEGSQKIGDVTLPERVRQTRNGVTALDVVVLPAPAPAHDPFVVPDGFATPTADAAPAGPLRLERLVDGVWIVSGIGGADYNALVVEGKESLLVVEAPQNARAMQDVVKLLESKLAKPIRTAVVTHHHFDHAGGARALLAAGAALHVPAETVALFDAIAAAPRTIEPDGVTVDPHSAVIQPVRDDVTNLDVDGRTVELHLLRETGHAAEVIFVRIPEAGIVFQGDLFVKRAEPEPARRQARPLLERLDQLHPPVKQIVGVHGEIATLEELREAVGRK